MATRCGTPQLLTNEYPPVVHGQQSRLQAVSCHPIQGTVYVMLTAAFVLGLLPAHRETHRVFELSPCYYDLTKNVSVNDFAPSDSVAAGTLAEDDAIESGAPWAALHDRLPFHNDPNRKASSTLLPHEVGVVAHRRCHYVRVMSVLRSPQARLRVTLARPRLMDLIPRAVPEKEEPWAVPASFT